MADPIIGKISVGDGATFTPAVDSDGVISWTNNKNLPNPASVDIPQAVVDRYQLAPTSNPTFTGTVTAEDITASGTITGDLVGDVTGTAQNATNDGDGNNIASTYLPAVVGAVVAFAGSTSPDGWLLCDGSAVSRTTYAALFAVIGTTYGSGDGSTTFNLPNLTNKFIQGNATSGTVKAAGLPNITGTVTPMLPNNASGSYISLPMSTGGAFQSSSSGTRNYYSSAGTTTKNDWGWATSFDASRSSSIYGNSTTVQPPAVTMRYIIKY